LGGEGEVEAVPGVEVDGGGDGTVASKGGGLFGRLGRGEKAEGKVLEAEVDAEDAGGGGDGLEVLGGVAQAVDEDALGAGFGETAGGAESFESGCGLLEKGLCGHGGMVWMRENGWR
jgi:hypothetical protein